MDGDDERRPEQSDAATAAPGAKRAAAKQLAQARAVRALEALHRRVLPFILRRTKGEVLKDLPPKIVQDVLLELTPQQEQLYAELLKELGPSVANAARALAGEQQQQQQQQQQRDPGGGGGGNTLAAVSQLLMACTHPLVALRAMAKGASSRLGKRQLEARISLVKDLGAKASCKFRAVESLLSDHILLDVDLGDARLRGISQAAAAQSSAADSHSGGAAAAPAPAAAADADADADAAAAAANEGAEQAEPAAAAAPTAHKCLIFAQWKGTLDLLEQQVFKEAFQGRLRYLRLDGSVAPHERQAVVNRFNGDASISCLLATTKVGGQGLNLTSADMVIFLENSWNPQEDLQAMDRAHRIGQRRCVHVFRLIARASVEERLFGLQRFKLHVAGAVVDAANSDVRSMQTDRVIDVLGAATSAADLPPAGVSRLARQMDEQWAAGQYDEFDVGNFQVRSSS